MQYDLIIQAGTIRIRQGVESIPVGYSRVTPKRNRIPSTTHRREVCR